MTHNTKFQTILQSYGNINSVLLAHPYQVDNPNKLYHHLTFNQTMLKLYIGETVAFLTNGT